MHFYFFDKISDFLCLFLSLGTVEYTLMSFVNLYGKCTFSTENLEELPSKKTRQ